MLKYYNLSSIYWHKLLVLEFVTKKFYNLKFLLQNVQMQCICIDMYIRKKEVKSIVLVVHAFSCFCI